MEKLMDLHMHSYYSDDGEFSPEELVRQCAMRGIRVMSIADHNSVRANDAGRQAARRAGIRYVSGIEIDCTFRGVNLHVLGYGFDDTSDDFADIEDNISSQAATASRQMLCATRKMGFDVTGRRLLLEGPVDRGNVCRGAPWPGGIQGPSPASSLQGRRGKRR